MRVGSRKLGEYILVQKMTAVGVFSLSLSHTHKNVISRLPFPVFGSSLAGWLAGFLSLGIIEWEGPPAGDFGFFFGGFFFLRFLLGGKMKKEKKLFPNVKT